MTTDISRPTGLAADRFSVVSNTFSPPTAEPVFVDLSEHPVTSNIVRNGFTVPVATLDPTRYDNYILALPPAVQLELPRVVQQSIPALRKVTPGTVVDLRLERPNTIPIDIFPGVHADLQGEFVGAIASSTLFENTSVRNAILRYPTAAEVPTNERGAIIEALGNISVAVDDSHAEKSFERAFNTLRNVAAFR